MNFTEVNVNIQRRQRVSRACDQCRRKKIRCAGIHPCASCIADHHVCTYDVPSRRQRNVVLRNVEVLEKNLHRAEALLSMLLPDLNTEDFDSGEFCQDFSPLSRVQRIGAAVQETHPTMKTVMRGMPLAVAINGPCKPAGARLRQCPGTPPCHHSQQDIAVALIKIDDRNWLYRGASSDAWLIRQVIDFIEGSRYVLQINGCEAAFRLTHSFDSPRMVHTFPLLRAPIRDVLPLPHAVTARTLCKFAFRNAFRVMTCVHQPTFFVKVDCLYAEGYTPEHDQFLPLLYTTLAVGYLCMIEDATEKEWSSKAHMRAEGQKYCDKARHLLDTMDCTHLESLQALVLVVFFLQGTTDLSVCFVYIGMALRSAIRMGLHRSLENHLSPFEIEMRKRVFWIIRYMDLHIACMLGMPQLLQEDDFDQEYPLDFDDDSLAARGVLGPSIQIYSSYISFVSVKAMFRLLKTVTKVIRHMYTNKVPATGDQCIYNKPDTYKDVVKEIEDELQAWKLSLPFDLALQPIRSSHVASRLQLYLHLNLAYTRMMLYRPFLRPQCSEPGKSSLESFGKLAVEAARDLIHIIALLRSQSCLMGTCFAVHMTSSAITTLLGYVVQRPSEAAAILLDAKLGKTILAYLAGFSAVAERTCEELGSLLEVLHGLVPNMVCNNLLD